MQKTSDWLAFAEGARRRTLQDGAKMMLVEVHFQAGAVGAEHSHPHEQVAYVVRGRVTFSLSGQKFEMSAGDSILIPGDVVHGVVAIEESVLLDTFAPPREDFRQSAR
jgi:quercetin dioxygenase-like cupin family protein